MSMLNHRWRGCCPPQRFGRRSWEVLLQPRSLLAMGDSSLYSEHQALSEQQRLSSLWPSSLRLPKDVANMILPSSWNKNAMIIFSFAVCLSGIHPSLPSGLPFQELNIFFFLSFLFSFFTFFFGLAGKNVKGL